MAVGGLRGRLIRDSLSHLLRTGLAQAGWFDEGRSHLPLQIVYGPHTWSVPVTFNTIVVTSQSAEITEFELGSNLTQDQLLISADLYAESDAFGIEVSNDMRDLLRGRLPGGATNGQVPILDFRLPTPAPIGYVTVAGTAVQRVVDQVPEEWARHLFSLMVSLQDVYY